MCIGDKKKISLHCKDVTRGESKRNDLHVMRDVAETGHDFLI